MLNLSIVILSLLLCVAVGYIIYLVKRLGQGSAPAFSDNVLAPAEQKEGDETYEDADGAAVAQTVRNVLHKLNCTYSEAPEENGDRVFEYGFQSGSFRLYTKAHSKIASLEFPGIDTVEADDLNLVRAICNDLNTNTISQFFYYRPTEDGKVQVDISCSLVIDPHLPDFDDYLSTLMTRCFEARTRYVQHWKETKKISDETDTDDIEAHLIQNNSMLRLLREQELRHQYPAVAELRPNSAHPLYLEDLLTALYEQACPFFLKAEIHCDGDMREVKGESEVAQISLLEPFVKAPADEQPQNMIVFVQYRLYELADDPTSPLQYLLINVLPQEETETLRYFRITVCRIAQNIRRDISLANRENSDMAETVLVAYDKADNRKMRAEFKYMWEDAKDKVRDGRRSELTPEQELIFDVVHPNVAFNLYRGRALFSQGRFYEALLHLKNAEQVLNRNYHQLHKTYEERFYEIQYLIGFCYCELKLYKQAYFYLSRLQHKQQIKYAAEFINCLVNMQDYEALDTIEDYLDSIAQLRNACEEDEEAMPEAIIDFENFLRRRRAYVLIDIGSFDEAEVELNKMLDEPENADFALGEIDYLRQLRQDEEDAREQDEDPNF